MNFILVVATIFIISFLLAVWSLIGQNRKEHILKEAQKKLEKGRVVFQRV